MKITTKINLITTAWLLCILIIINVVVYFSFMKITVNMEEEVLIHRAADILKEVNFDQKNTLNEQLKNYLTIHSYIRIIPSDKKSMVVVTNDKYLTKKVKAKYTTKLETNRRMISANNGEEQILYVRVPYKSKQNEKGTLEIGERLIGLEMRKDILLTILGFCTVLAALISLFGGKWLSNIMIKPISRMIKTMEDIENSGVPKKIITKNKTKDELEILATTFNRMIERLVDNMDKQEQFISDASHELKTPLTVIKSYANLLRRRGIRDNELTYEAIEAIYSEATRIQKMTETFLTMATSKKESSLEINTINLISLCQKIKPQLEAAFNREIMLHYSTESILLEVDELKLKQVIIILLDNAIKYSSKQIDVFFTVEDDHVALQIKDYGIGIPQQEIERIFERFYRVDKARSRQTGGTGLGLSIAKSIIKLHKGEINIKSEENKGTEVEIILPI